MSRTVPRSTPSPSPARCSTDLMALRLFSTRTLFGGPLLARNPLKPAHVPSRLRSGRSTAPRLTFRDKSLGKHDSQSRKPWTEASARLYLESSSTRERDWTNSLFLRAPFLTRAFPRYLFNSESQDRIEVERLRQLNFVIELKLKYSVNSEFGNEKSIAFGRDLERFSN